MRPLAAVTLAALGIFAIWIMTAGSRQDTTTHGETRTEARASTAGSDAVPAPQLEGRPASRLAAEATRSGAAARSEVADLPKRARDLALALPTVARSFEHGVDDRDLTCWREPAAPDALDGLSAIGYPAVPALREALADLRPTRSTSSYFKPSMGLELESKMLPVRKLALFALHRITQRTFLMGKDLEDASWEEVAAQVDAWWRLFEAQGERAVLEDGVLAGGRAAAAQARLLVARYPDGAFAAIRRAATDAEPDVLADLLSALAPLARDDVKAFLLQHVRAGRLGPRIAAARSLRLQGRNEGLDLLLEEWPTLAQLPEEDSQRFWAGLELEKLTTLFFRLHPTESLKRVRATLGALDAYAKATVINEIKVALGYDHFRGAEHPPERLQPPEVTGEAEALIIDLVLEEEDREGPRVTAAAISADDVGQRAAGAAAAFWPDRYAWNEESSARDRLSQRFAIVNAWRTRTGRAPFPLPSFPKVEPLAPEESRALVDAWLAATDDSSRARERDAVLASGLGVLPALRLARDGLAAWDSRREELDLLVRQVAVILREVTWAPDSLKPSATFDALVREALGKPVTGAWITGLWCALACETSGEATSLDLTLTRPGDDTGAVVVLDLRTDTADGRGNTDGWVLLAGGWECVNDAFLRAPGSWWRNARGSQLDEEILLPEGKEVRLRRTISKVR
jgi:hypothetical protein